MIAGFQSIGETGSYQVDSEFANLALVRSGQLVSQQYTNGETTNTTPTRAQLTLNDGEILALSCSVFCSLGSKVGTTAYVYVNAQAGQVINYYVFKPGDTGVSTAGLQLFDGLERITFDSGWGLFDVRSMHSGYSSLNLPAGKTYAFVQCQIGTQVNYNRVVNGMPPNYFTFFIRTTSFSSYRINSGLIECSLQTVDIAATRPSVGGGGNSYSDTYSNNVTPIALIIDVTGM